MRRHLLTYLLSILFLCSYIRGMKPNEYTHHHHHPFIYSPTSEMMKRGIYICTPLYFICIFFIQKKEKGHEEKNSYPPSSLSVSFPCHPSIHCVCNKRVESQVKTPNWDQSGSTYLEKSTILSWSILFPLSFSCHFYLLVWQSSSLHCHLYVYLLLAFVICRMERKKKGGVLKISPSIYMCVYV